MRVVLLLALLLAGGGCVSRRSPTCNAHSHCWREVDGGDARVPSGTFCSNQGRCEQECRVDQDCPCDAVCATSCGVCLRFEADGGTAHAATCFATGLTPADLLGACGLDLATLATRSRSRACVAGDLARCPAGFVGIPIPSEDAGANDAGADGDGGARTDAGTDADAARDAANAAADADAGVDADAGGGA